MCASFCFFLLLLLTYYIFVLLLSYLHLFIIFIPTFVYNLKSLGAISYTLCILVASSSQFYLNHDFFLVCIYSISYFEMETNKIEDLKYMYMDTVSIFQNFNQLNGQ